MKSPDSLTDYSSGMVSTFTSTEGVTFFTLDLASTKVLYKFSVRAISKFIVANFLW